MIFNYQKICSNLLSNLPERTRDVIVRRFGLDTGKRETLESIGTSYNITRERVRQIESDGLSKISRKIEKDHKVFQHFASFLKNYGGLKKEDILLSELGNQNHGSHVFFLLNLSDDFKRIPETKDTHCVWAINSQSLDSTKNVIKDLYKKFKRTKKVLNLKECNAYFALKPNVLLSYLETSKLIDKGPEGKFGLRDWAEINPRGVKDKAFLIFKKENKPLHFSKVANLIGENALVQTVHNELIRDSRFVLIGRGIYALADWGYESGTVKDVISHVLKGAETPLSKDEVLERVLEKRFVKENTVLLNLSNKEHFLRNPQGKYLLRDA